MIYGSLNNSHNIGICAPSAGVGHKLESFDKSLEALHSHGFSTLLTDSVKNNDIRSASAEIRGKELNNLVKNESIGLILAASGGDYNMEMLPFIDEQAIIDNPKWYCGASDPTNILYYITTKLDIATMYGVNAGTWDWEPLHEFQENSLEILKGNIIEQHSFDKYVGSRDFWNDDEPALDTDVYWISSCDKFEVTGRLIGGCLDVISKLIGTPYDGTASFVDRYADSDGIVWYFDVFDMQPEVVYLTLLQMKFAGYFRGAKMLVFGRTMFPREATDEMYVENIRTFCDGLGIPFIYNADIGHVKPCMMLINGSIATFTCEDGKGTLRMELR